MAARLYQRSKNAMQSGMARADEWVLEFESSAPLHADPLMGWAGGSDTKSQVKLTFDTLEAAKGYADRHGVQYHVIPPAVRTLKIQSYADNFK